MNPYPFKVEQQMQQFYHSLSEKDRRRYAAIEAVKLGWGGITYISQLFGCDYYTIRFGIEELDDESAMNMSEIRRSGGGRKSAFETIEGLDSALLESHCSAYSRFTNGWTGQMDEFESTFLLLNC